MSVRISVSEAKAQLTDLVRQAEAGEDVVLTRHGHPAVRLTPVRRPLDGLQMHAFLAAIGEVASAKATPGPDAARSQDFLFGEDGLPG